MPSNGKTLLSLDNVTMKFGGVTALNGVNLEVKEGEILALIGPNGAGKTTVFNVITGVYKQTSGIVNFDGTSLGKQKRFLLPQPLPECRFEYCLLCRELIPMGNKLRCS